MATQTEQLEYLHHLWTVYHAAVVKFVAEAELAPDETEGEFRKRCEMIGILAVIRERG